MPTNTASAQDGNADAAYVLPHQLALSSIRLNLFREITEERQKDDIESCYLRTASLLSSGVIMPPIIQYSTRAKVSNATRPTKNLLKK